MNLIKHTLTTTLIFSLSVLGLGTGLAGADEAVPSPARQTERLSHPPARIAGERGTLTIRQGMLEGDVGGRRFSAQVTADRARGTGPRGSIDVMVTAQESGQEVSGTWNGGRVRFVIKDGTIRGRATRATEAGSYVSCSYSLGRGIDGRSYAGTSHCIGAYRAGHLEVHARAPAELTEAQNAILLVAYLAAASGPVPL